MRFSRVINRQHYVPLVLYHHYIHGHKKNIGIRKSFVQQTLPSQISRYSSHSPSVHYDSQINGTNISSSQLTEEEQVWQFLPCHFSNVRTEQQPGTARTISNLLVCGDGDLSYSASIAPTLQTLGIQMISTVLETEELHCQTYSQSNTNRNIIESFGHAVHFGVDATELHIHPQLASNVYDRIQFNFPHCPGKSNTRKNRLLLQGFLQSSSQLLATPTTMCTDVVSYGGEVHVALFTSQGGASAKTLQDWKKSWLATHLAAECGLLLASVTPFTNQYKRSSYRGKDKPFHHFSNNNNNNAQLYKFVLGHTSAEEKEKKGSFSRSISDHLQLCFRHELHIHLPSTTSYDDLQNEIHPQSIIHYSQTLLKDLVQGDLVRSKIQELLPHGVLVEVPCRHQQVVRAEVYHDCCNAEKKEKEVESAIICFLIVYRSVTRPITRTEANSFREQAEQMMMKMFTLRRSRMGKPVSRPFPYGVLPSIVADLELLLIETKNQ
jgi:hypothetical protein